MALNLIAFPQLPYAVRYEWATDVQRTPTKEHRLMLRDLPRAVYTYTYHLQQSQLGAFKAFFRNKTNSWFWLPRFESPLATSYPRLAYNSTNYEVLDDGTTSLPGAIEVPLTKAFLTQPPSYIVQNHVTIATISAVTSSVPEFPETLSYPSYLGFPVLTDFNLAGGDSDQNSMETELFETESGSTESFFTLNAPRLTGTFNWNVNREDHNGFLGFLCSRAGRKYPFWYLSRTNDVQAINFLPHPTLGTKGLITHTPVDGLDAEFYLELTTGSGTYRVKAEQITSDGIVTDVRPVSSTPVSYCQRITLVRFDDDSVEIEFGAGYAATNVRFIECPL